MKIVPKSMAKSINRFFGKFALKVSKHLPEILIYGGIAVGGATVVVACVETTKVDPILDEAKDNVETVHETVAEAENRELAIQNSKKELTKIYIKTGAKLVKNYIPSIAMGTISVCAILSGHNILKKRNVAIAAAYTALNKTLNDYRGRVKAKIGEKDEADLFYNTKTTTVIDSETGEMTEIHELNDSRDNYELMFGPNCPFWDRDPNYSELTISNVAQYGNDLLESKGHVFLNDLLFELGMNPTMKGQVCGWVKDSSAGDSYVDLRPRKVEVPDTDGKMVTAFILDPNVDGTILYNFTKELNK